MRAFRQPNGIELIPQIPKEKAELVQLMREYDGVREAGGGAAWGVIIELRKKEEKPVVEKKGKGKG